MVIHLAQNRYQGAERGCRSCRVYVLQHTLGAIFTECTVYGLQTVFLAFRKYYGIHGLQDVNNARLQECNSATVQDVQIAMCAGCIT